MNAARKIVIDAEHARRNYRPEFFRYRELFYFRAWHDLLVCYEQTMIGILWAFLRPFLTYGSF
jgi:homopolymeric O-antigen transport system permease protein